VELLLNRKTKWGVTVTRLRRATSCCGAVTLRRTTSGSGRRSCFIAWRRWPSLRRVLPPATLELQYPPLQPPFLLQLFCSCR
jgi:hypothetical protein